MKFLKITKISLKRLYLHSPDEVNIQFYWRKIGKLVGSNKRILYFTRNSFTHIRKPKVNFVFLKIHTYFQ
jgi:hypothetical protein